MRCDPQSAPKVTIAGASDSSPQGSILGEITSKCSIIVREDELAVELQVKMVSDLTAYLDQWVIMGSLNDLRVEEVAVIQSNIESGISVDGIKDLLNSIIALTLSTLNEMIFADGIILPEGDVDMTDSQVLAKDCYLYAAATPVYAR